MNKTLKSVYIMFSQMIIYTYYVCIPYPKTLLKHCQVYNYQEIAKLRLPAQTQLSTHALNSVLHKKQRGESKNTLLLKLVPSTSKFLSSGLLAKFFKKNTHDEYSTTSLKISSSCQPSSCLNLILCPMDIQTVRPPAFCSASPNCG